MDLQELQQFDNFELFAQQIVEGFITGLHRSPYHGFSVEFAEHRAYNKGESIKHIDWKLYGRTDKLYVKRYEEETNLRSQIIIDTSSSMLFPFPEKKVQNKLGFSVFCAAALIHLLKKQRDAIGLSLFSDSLHLHTPSKLSRVHIQMLFAELAKVLEQKNSQDQLKKTTNIPSLLHQISDTIHTRSLVMIFSDMIDDNDQDEVFSALQHLKYNKHEVILFHVSDHQKEKNLQFENRPTKFIDLETGESIKLNPNDVREKYIQSNIEAFETLKLRCMQYQIDLIEADINKGFDQVLLSYLVKRNKLY